MINYLIRLAICGAVVYLIPNYLKDIYVDSYVTAFIVAFAMSLLNNFVKPVLNLIAIPITILTLGLFYFVITVLMVYICDFLIDGFSVSGFINPLIFSFLLSIVNSIVGAFQE
ncbi:phage holin family protein [Emticicia sp. CRIBPO]|uniref:phage holin family protein n=1 Tax=Emticicia sp. CRIBPO TaxID=2683258 RepID=UPI001412FB20|nr:phage holin family protein [Emticicia sp. CRIBPO]NBA86886.1 phage holin family protein [Emticicia sp. CRIBPO]